MNFLSDNWNVSGTDFDEFKENLSKLANHTKFIRVNMDECHFLNITDIGTELAAVCLSGKNLWKKTKNLLSLRKFEFAEDSLITCGYEEDVSKEAICNGLLLTTSKKYMSLARNKKLLNSGKYIPVSEKAINTIANRISYGGYEFSKNGLVRDIAIANGFSKPTPVYMIIREDCDVENQKLFAIMSDKYRIISQETMLNIIDMIKKVSSTELGTATCSYWEISHSITKIYIDFAEHGKELAKEYGLPIDIIPGIMLETSDIGDCSFRLKGYYKIDEHLTYMKNEYSQIHTGAVDEVRIVNEAVENIFPEYRTYPEKLANLMSIDLVDKSIPVPKKIKKLSSLYRDISRKIGLVAAIGKKREKLLIDQMIESINPDLDYTAYDIAMNFLTLSSSINTKDKRVLESIAKVSKHVLDYYFEEYNEFLLF